jgi:uncharacterized membrane protein
MTTERLHFFLFWILSFAFTSAIDALWHFVIFRKSYREGMRPVARMKGERMSPRAGASLLAQVLVVTCLVFLVGLGSLSENVGLAVFVGALAGVLAISVYGITNYALLKDWSLKLTVLEVVWGPILGGLSGYFIFWARTWLAVGPR